MSAMHLPLLARRRRCSARRPATMLACLRGRRLAVAVAGLVGGPRCCRARTLPQGAEWRYDVSRINELRRVDVALPPLPAGDPAAWPASTAPCSARACRRSSAQIQAAGLPRFWLPEEYLGRAGAARPVRHAALRLLFFSAVRRPPGWCWPCWPCVLTAWLLRHRLAGPGRAPAAA